ncbi:MAG: phosphoribosyl-AMP cyclohydrolase [Rhizobiaceae bacterium]
MPSKNITDIEFGDRLTPRYNSDGLITAIVTDSGNNEVLMVAHMNAEALEKTLETQQSHFWSRSRKELWHKGATSGDIQFVEEIRVDCDQDAVVLKVRMAGNSACHTGKRACFYRRIENENGQFKLVMDES